MQQCPVDPVEYPGQVLRLGRGRKLVIRLDDGREIEAILSSQVLDRAGDLPDSFQHWRVRVRFHKHPKAHRIVWLGADT